LERGAGLGHVVVQENPGASTVLPVRQDSNKSRVSLLRDAFAIVGAPTPRPQR
jgi:hypothetical protein